MKKAVKTISLKKRISSPSPSLFNRIKKYGLIVSGIGTAILASPVVLPALITSIAGYLVTTGLVASAVSMVTVAEKAVK
jgi:hypothetical protein